MSDLSNIWPFELRAGNSHDPRKGADLLAAIVAPDVAILIAALDGILKISRQAEPIAPEEMQRAVPSFAMASGQ